MGFFRAALDKKVIAVPGEFFDVNPGKRRSQRASRFRHYVRFSFGPAMDSLETALGRLETLDRRSAKGLRRLRRDVGQRRLRRAGQLRIAEAGVAGDRPSPRRC